MTGAMYAAIAGLKTHMSKMNVIGNNIANVNTAGYKSQRTVFKDAMYTMYRSGADGTSTTGGRNPAQIGYGSQLSTIDLNMTSGSYSPGTSMDCMIDGDGFFLVGNKTTADNITATNPSSFKGLNLTRVGDFGFDSDGYLVDGNGSCVYGFLTVGYDDKGDPIVSDQLVPIRLPKQQTINLDATGNPTDDPAAVVSTKTEVRYPVVAGTPDAIVSDSAGLLAATDQVKLTDYDTFYNSGQADPADQINLAFAQMNSISISEKGQITGIVEGSDTPVVIGYLAVGSVTNPNGVTHTGGFYYQAGDGAGDLSVSLMAGLASDITTVGGGTLSYVNGGLVDAAAAVTPSEKARVGSAGGQILTGGLEGSNVDLATEISDMITTQRGYQANTRIITVTDTMLEELVNMKR